MNMRSLAIYHLRMVENGRDWNLVPLSEKIKWRSMVVENGEDTNFWFDKQCGQASLQDKFPRLYEISNDQDCSVAEMKKKVLESHVQKMVK